jgi:membrane fusion protein (multidrug efflux system)
MNKLTIAASAFVALVAGIVVYNKVLGPQNSVPGKSSVQKNRVLQVTGFVVHPRKLQNSIVSSGTLTASEDVDLHSQVSGTITSMGLKEGTYVAKGSLLVKLFDDDLQAQLKKLQAQKESAERTEARLKQLLSINGVGQQEYDNALTQLKGTVADIDNISAQIEKTEIRAPFGGVVGLNNVSVGAYITPAVTIASLQQIEPMKLDFSIPEKYASTIRTGDQIRFDVDGFPNAFAAKVVAVEPRIDQETRTIKVRALVRNPDPRLMPGAFASVELDLKSVDNAIMIPTQCIIPDLRGSKVVLIRNGKAEFRSVETGTRTEDFIQVSSGVQSGDTVASTALMTIKPNMNVMVRLAAPDQPDSFTNKIKENQPLPMPGQKRL